MTATKAALEWKIGDELWEQVEPLVPALPPRPKGGRPRMDNRRAFEAMLYVLRHNIHWKALPRELGAGSTVHDRFHEWAAQAFFEHLDAAGLTRHRDLADIEWERRAGDEVPEGAEPHLFETHFLPKREYRRRQRRIARPAAETQTNGVASTNGT